MAEHLILHGGGAQTLRHVPMDPLARPTLVGTASYTIVDLRKATTSPERVIASGIVTVDAASTMLAADAGPSASGYPERLSVVDATAFVDGRKYLLSKDDGLREVVTAVRVDDDNGHVYGQFAIRGDYEAGDALEGVELEAPFPASEADDEDDTVKRGDHPGYQIVWGYEIDGKQYLVGERIRVSRYSVQPPISADEIILGYPGLARRLAPNDVTAATRCAWKDILGELEAGGHDPSLVRTGNSGEVLHRYLTLHYLTLGMPGDDDRELTDRFYQRYKELLHRMFNAGKAPRDVVVLSQVTDTPTNEDFSDLFVTGRRHRDPGPTRR